MSQVPGCNPLHCRVLVPDNEDHCPPAEITLIAHILRGPCEHSLAFAAQLRSHFAFVNYFVVFGVTQRMIPILRGGAGGGGCLDGICLRRRKKGNIWDRTAGISQIKQGSSVNRDRKAQPGKGIQRFKEIFSLDQTSENHQGTNTTPDLAYICLLVIIFFISSRRSDMSSSGFELLTLDTAVVVYLSPL